MSVASLTGAAAYLCEGQSIRIGLPELSEYDRIIQLRNSPQLLRWSFDTAPVDSGAIWVQMRFGIGRPYAVLLAIRDKDLNHLLGMVGWYNWDQNASTAWLGQLVLDPLAMRPIIARRQRNGISIGLDAGCTLRDYLFLRLNLQTIFTYHLAGNTASERITLAAGFDIYDRMHVARSDGSRVDITLTRIDRSKWESLGMHAISIGSGP